MNWNEYEGREVGEWTLDSFLGERDGKVFFTTHRSAASKQLLLQLVPRDADRDNAALESWNIARELTHENVLRPYASGDSLVGGVGVHYAVMDLPDDDLGEVLGKKLPSRSEARKILTGVESGLKYLHARGLSHGALSPSNVFFVTGGTRLGVDTLRPVGDTDRDLQQLHALRDQLGLREPAGTHTKVIVGGIALILVLLAVFLFKPRTPEPPPVAKVERPKVVHTPDPVVPKQTPLGPPKMAIPPARTTYSAGNSWGVVAATYKDYGMADKYAKILRKRLPDLKIHASPPDGQGKLYLVVLATGMTRDQADQLRGQVVSQGAPRDCYVTKLDEP